MAFTDPTPSDLTRRFPVFDAVETDVINTALNEAASLVDDTWVSEADHRLGKMLVAAHVLTSDGHGATVEAELAQAGHLSLMRSGSLTVQSAPARSDAWLATTSFGRRFLALRRRSVPAVTVIC